MSLWRRRELDPIGTWAQISCLVGSGSPKAARGSSDDVRSRVNDSFSECLQQLQAIHEHQVSTLAGEVGRLHDELEILRKGSCEETATALMITNRDRQAQWLKRANSSLSSLGSPAGETGGPPPPALVRGKTPAPLGRNRRFKQRTSSLDSPDLAEPSEAVLANTKHHNHPNSKDTSKETSRDASKDSSKGSKGTARNPSKATGHLSADVAAGIGHQLSQYRSERSTIVRLPTKGSMLLDEYCSYRQKRSLDSNKQGFSARLVSSSKFDFCMGVIIVMNAVTIGWEVSASRAGHDVPKALHVAEYIFLSIYTLEILLRFWVIGRRAIFNSFWVQFDLFLVICGCLDVATTIAGPPVKVLDNVLLVRTFRLARLARVMRLNIKFHTLWMLVSGLLNSLATLAWTSIIIFILLFVFAVIGLEIIVPDPSASEEYNKVVHDNFGSLHKALISLLQGLTLDSFAGIYRPLLLEKPLMVFYFLPFLLVVAISLMNLVTALMVNFSLEQAIRDKEVVEQLQTQQKAEVIRILERAFIELDTNNSGCVELEEMLAAPEELRTLICEVAEVSGDADIESIFNTLDFGNTGALKIEDFCQGLLMLHSQKALESYFVMKYCSSILDMLKPRQKGGEAGSLGNEVAEGGGDTIPEESSIQLKAQAPFTHKLSRVALPS